MFQRRKKSSTEQYRVLQSITKYYKDKGKIQRIYFDSFLGLFVFECIYFPDLCFPILKNGPIFVCTDPATAQHSVFFNICSEKIWKILLPHFCANSYSTFQHVVVVLSNVVLGKPPNTTQRIFFVMGRWYPPIPLTFGGTIIFR